MRWEYRSDIHADIKKVHTNPGIVPQGIVLETVELQARVFGDWAPSHVPERIIRDTLAKAIADELVIDVAWSTDPRSGYSTGKFSSVVYMKPNLKELNEANNRKDSRILEINKERLVLEKKFLNTSKELSRTEDEKFKLEIKNSKLTVEMNCKFHDYRFLLKQGFRMLWLEIKCELFALARFVPFRG